LRGQFDDNVTFRRSDELSDYSGMVSPGFTLDYASELLEYKATAVVDVLRYAQEKDFNTEKQRYELDGGYRFAERWRGTGEISFVKDTTLDSQLEETGIVYDRQNRERLRAGAGLFYQLSEVSDTGAEYRYERTNYEEEGLDDYDYNSFRLSYGRRFNNDLDRIRVEPGYTQGESDDSDVDGYRLVVRWTRLASETYRVGVALGVRYTTTDFKDDRDTRRNWGGVADINLVKTGESSSIEFGFKSDAYFEPSRSEIRQVYRLYGGYTRRIFERLSAGINARVSLSQSDDEDADDDDDVWYFAVDPFLSYRLTENYFLRLGYVYQQEYDKNVEDDERRDRNRISLTLNFNFPYKW
jgi:hypothetical protein